MSDSVPHADQIGLESVCFFLDATPLLDVAWTGISIVCANIACQLIERGYQLEFCLEQAIVPKKAVHEALNRWSGLYLARGLATGHLSTTKLTWPRQNVSIGLSASVKRFNRVFDIECSWIHDISTLLQPEYHTTENLAWHTERIVQDLESNDFTVCISRATLEDLVAYLGADPARLILVHNGVAWPWWFTISARNELADVTGPYLLVLGTREPRKNLTLIFKMLAAFPKLLTSHRLVIVGGDGWSADQIRVPPSLAEAVKIRRITVEGFVSDYDKYRLLRSAEAVIFPSLFEGFGLPVLESLSVGTSCVASFSSSIPEIGGECCRYFDPFSVVSLYEALVETLALSPKRNVPNAAAASAWIANFDWENSIAKVLLAMGPLIEQSRAKKDKGDAIHRK